MIVLILETYFPANSMKRSSALCESMESSGSIGRMCGEILFCGKVKSASRGKDIERLRDERERERKRWRLRRDSSRERM